MCNSPSLTERSVTAGAARAMQRLTSRETQDGHFHLKREGKRRNVPVRWLGARSSFTTLCFVCAPWPVVPRFWDTCWCRCWTCPRCRCAGHWRPESGLLCETGTWSAAGRSTQTHWDQHNQHSHCCFHFVIIRTEFWHVMLDIYFIVFEHPCHGQITVRLPYAPPPGTNRYFFFSSCVASLFTFALKMQKVMFWSPCIYLFIYLFVCVLFA